MTGSRCDGMTARCNITSVVRHHQHNCSVGRRASVAGVGSGGPPGAAQNPLRALVAPPLRFSLLARTSLRKVRSAALRIGGGHVNDKTIESSSPNPPPTAITV